MRLAVVAIMAVAIAGGSAAQTPRVAPPPTPNFVIPPATIDNSLEVDGERLAAARTLDTRMAVDVAIGGQGPFRFLVDSGADRTVVGQALADRLALPQVGRVLLHGTAGSEEVSTVKLEGLTVGQGDVGTIEAPALPERYIGAQGMLGIDSLAGQRLMMDFQANQIAVQDARLPERGMAGADEIVVTARRQHGQLIIAQARAEGINLFAVIDSGADITIANSALHDRLFPGRRRPARPQEITLIGVTGQTLKAELIILPELQLGGVIVHDIPIAFADAPPFALFGLADKPALLLGTDLLRSFRRVSLDFRNRRVRFTLRR